MFVCLFVFGFRHFLVFFFVLFRLWCFLVRLWALWACLGLYSGVRNSHLLLLLLFVCCLRHCGSIGGAVPPLRPLWMPCLCCVGFPSFLMVFFLFFVFCFCLCVCVCVCAGNSLAQPTSAASTCFVCFVVLPPLCVVSIKQLKKMRGPVHTDVHTHPQTHTGCSFGKQGYSVYLEVGAW